MRNFKTKLLGLSLLVVALSACNRGFDKVVPASPNEPSGASVFKKPKVLYIIADGARGTQVRDANIPTLKSLLTHSIYTWNSLGDANSSTNATNWASMITGVSKEKHNVLTEDFVGNNLATYKTIFERIKSINPDLRIASFSSSLLFKNNLTAGTNVSENLTNDETVKSRMVDFLKTDAADLVVGEFSAIQAAGVAGTFDNSDAGYKNAINTFDTQVGAILDAVKSRTTYNSESWLIIISSNKGGPATLNPLEDDKTVFSNTNANTFSIIYNASYNPTFIGKPFVGNSYVGNAVRFRGWPHKGVAEVKGVDPQFNVNYSSAFNFGDTSSFTISVKIKKHKNPYNTSRGDYYYQWPAFLGKQGKSPTDNNPGTGWGGGASRGWNFCLFQNRWRFMIIGNKDGSGGLNEEIAGLEFSGDTWHDLTAVVERTPNGAKQVRVYTDGVMAITNRNNASLANPSYVPFVLGANPNFDNNSFLRLGWTTGEQDPGNSEVINTYGAIDVELKEFKIFKAALPDAVVKQYACDQSIDRSHPFYNFLVGYWPINEGSGTVLKDRVGLADMTLSQQQSNTPASGSSGPTAPLFSGYQWTAFTDLICSPPASNLGLLVPKNTDLPAQVLSWFNIARQSSWGLDGKVWIAK
ncbi:hypothetical protein [Mucilaginibacter antarcticus]|uniref:Type I phosphodiesterase/nucleotide pyrophosphatase n=1 Tax=Mucilaginibacter antarcticus TaxID=1855725 RepID=A0ABW5XQ18_9SPHI